MQDPGLDCERDEYPPVGFWQDQPIDQQWVRMVPAAQNEAAGAALFGLAVCRFQGQSTPPASTRNPQFQRVIHGPGRDTEVSTADVTTTLYTVSIRFDNYPNEPDFGMTANRCWPSTLVDDPGFALLTDDAWYFNDGNEQRYSSNGQYAKLPPLTLTQNNLPRPGYQKRFLDSVSIGIELEDRNATCKLTNTVAPLMGFSTPRKSEAEPTPADTHSVATATSRAPVIGGGAHLALGSIPRSTGAVEQH